MGAEGVQAVMPPAVARARCSSMEEFLSAYSQAATRLEAPEQARAGGDDGDSTASSEGRAPSAYRYDHMVILTLAASGLGLALGRMGW